MKDFKPIKSGEESITYGDYQIINENEIDKFLVDNVRQYKECTINDFDFSLKNALYDCESPIEQILAMEIERSRLCDIGYFNPDIELIGYDKQAKIECGKANYRVDFLFEVAYKKNKIPYKLGRFVIECDGYQFHRSTKEQLDYENKRTRDLQKEGYEIIRFSGREIIKSPHMCVREITRIILSKIKNEGDQL